MIHNLFHKNQNKRFKTKKEIDYKSIFYWIHIWFILHNKSEILSDKDFKYILVSKKKDDNCVSKAVKLFGVGWTFSL